MKDQLIMLLVFITLVFLDCITRWMAISYGRLQALGHREIGIWQVVCGIPAARRAGLIRSAVMKERGVEKLILYHLAVIAAAASDFLLRMSGGESYLSQAVIGYLGMTEFVSIIENLSDAGVKSMGEWVKGIKK